MLVEQYEGAPLGVVPLYGGEVWNAAGSRMRLRHIPRCRPGRRQRGMVQQLTNVDVYCNGERLGAPSCQALVWHGDTITFGAAFPRATLVTHVVEINPLFLQLSLTKRRQRPRALPTSLAPPAADPPRGPPPTGVKVVLCALVATSPSNSSWAIVAAESYRLASHGPPLHTGLVALRGTWPVSSVAQLGRGTVAYAHGPLPKPAPCEAQHTRTLQLHLVVEDALRLAHDEGAGVARPLCRHATPLPHFVEPSQRGAARSRRAAGGGSSDAGRVRSPARPPSLGAGPDHVGRDARPTVGGGAARAAACRGAGDCRRAAGGGGAARRAGARSDGAERAASGGRSATRRRQARSRGHGTRGAPHGPPPPKAPCTCEGAVGEDVGARVACVCCDA